MPKDGGAKRRPKETCEGCPYLHAAWQLNSQTRRRLRPFRRRTLIFGLACLAGLVFLVAHVRWH